MNHSHSKFLIACFKFAQETKSCWYYFLFC